MRKYLMALLMCLGLCLSGMVTIPTQAVPADPGSDAPMVQQAQRPNCKPFSDSRTSRRMVDGKWVDVKTKVNARQCFAPVLGNRWVDPISVEFSYNKEGSHTSCGFFDIFEGVHFDLYLKDGRGFNYHEPRVVLKCEQDTTNWDIRSLRDAPNLRVCHGIGPSWKTLWTIRRDNQNDQSGDHGGGLWNFIGPVKDECGHPNKIT